MWELLTQVVQTLWRALVLWWPVKFYIVPQGSECVVFTRGVPTSTHTSRCVFATSGQEVKTVHVRRRVLQTDAISLITADGVGLKIDVEAICSVANPVTYFVGSERAEWIAAFLFLSTVRQELQAATIDEVLKDMPQLLSVVVSEVAETLYNDAGMAVHTLGVRSIAFENPVVAATVAAAGLYERLPEDFRDNPALGAAILSTATVFTHPVAAPPELDYAPAEEPDGDSRQGGEETS